jgi:hypothetical protein
MHVAEVVGVRFNKSGPLHFRHWERERSNPVDGIFYCCESIAPYSESPPGLLRVRSQ